MEACNGNLGERVQEVIWYIYDGVSVLLPVIPLPVQHMGQSGTQAGTPILVWWVANQKHLAMWCPCMCTAINHLHAYL